MHYRESFESIRSWTTLAASSAVRAMAPHPDTWVGPVTVAKAYRLLKAILNTAVDDGLIRRNPCRIKGAGTDIEGRSCLFRGEGALRTV